MAVLFTRPVLKPDRHPYEPLKGTLRVRGKQRVRSRMKHHE